ncbi:uncharacterized protein LOC142012937 [Carettochelys insculpta]|uniref:uncharacterized protein LOC142012937 n=1 Tax=Carettochelys insculpta TaxID=44489 RepID=UPI003EC1336B
MEKTACPGGGVRPGGKPRTPEAPPGAHLWGTGGGGVLLQRRRVRIHIPSRSSSRASAHRASPDRGSGPSAAPAEGLESASEVSVVPESPPGPSHQASPSAEHRPAPRRGRQRSQPHSWTATDPQLLEIHRQQLQVSEQRLWVEERRLQLQEQALACRQEAWGAFMRTFACIVDYLAPHAAPAAALPALPAPPAAPPTLLHLLLHPLSHRHPPPRALPPRGTWGQLTPAGLISWSARPPASPGQG